MSIRFDLDKGVLSEINVILNKHMKEILLNTGFMGWHTNSDNPCQRLYITWTPEGNKSFFRYLKGDEVITDYDDADFTVRMFDVTAQEPYMWHCVGSETDRISMGFAIK